MSLQVPPRRTLLFEKLRRTQLTGANHALNTMIENIEVYQEGTF